MRQLLGGTCTIKLSTISFFTFALLALACSQQHKSSQDPKDYSGFLYVAPGAENVRFAKNVGRNDVYYDLHEDFPAKTFLANVDGFLKKNGFEVQKYDLLNPTIQNSYFRGWSDFEDHTKNPPRMVQQWMTDWRNDKGEYVVACLRYTWPVGKRQNTDGLEVVLMFVPKETADAMKKWATEPNEKKTKEKGAP